MKIPSYILSFLFGLEHSLIDWGYHQNILFNCAASPSPKISCKSQVNKKGKRGKRQSGGRLIYIDEPYTLSVSPTENVSGEI